MPPSPRSRKKGKEVRFALKPITVAELQIRFCHIFDHAGNLIEFIQHLEWHFLT